MTAGCTIPPAYAVRSLAWLQNLFTGTANAGTAVPMTRLAHGMPLRIQNPHHNSLVPRATPAHATWPLISTLTGHPHECPNSSSCKSSSTCCEAATCCAACASSVTSASNVALSRASWLLRALRLASSSRWLLASWCLAWLRAACLASFCAARTTALLSGGSGLMTPCCRAEGPRPRPHR